MPLAHVDCDSRISHVQLYARGAVVTRSLYLPTLPSSPLRLRVSGLSQLILPGSLRVSVDGQRPVVSVDASLSLPDHAPPSSGAAVQRLEHTLRALSAQRRLLGQQRALFNDPSPDLALRPRRQALDVLSRVNAGLAVARLSRDLSADLDQRLSDLDRQLDALRDDLSAARLALSQTSTPTDDATPSFTALIQLAPGDLSLNSLSLSYDIEAARWWPAYTVRLSDRGQRAALSLDAFIAQDSGEDWSDARLSLVTADLLRDVSLPKLTSLRLGRRQPAPPSGYRPPPEGLDHLFAGHDDAVGALSTPPMDAKPDALARFHRHDEGAFADDMIHASGDDYTGEFAKFADGSPPAGMSGGIGGLIQAGEEGMGGAPSMASQKGRGRAEKKKMSMVGVAARLSQSRVRAYRSRAPEYEMMEDLDDDEAGHEDYEEAFGVIPGDEWLDFRALVLAGPTDPQRGQLIRQPPVHTDDARRRAVRHIASMTPPHGAVDPLAERGHFDHRYEGQGAVDVPSDGRAHRIPLREAAAPSSARFRAIPLHLEEVFREVELVNPFEAPLLAGPADIFIDDALALTAPLAAVERGGTLTLGLGVEERLTVARNVRTHEDRSGLLKGTSNIHHEISVELSSALPHPVTVELLDRVPITDDREVSIEAISSTPQAAPYRQEERGAPVDGGLRWEVALAPGQRQEVFFQFTVTLSGKRELHGGNRRG